MSERPRAAPRTSNFKNPCTFTYVKSLCRGIFTISFTIRSFPQRLIWGRGGLGGRRHALSLSLKKPRHSFSKVSALVYLLYKVTTQRTFEKVLPGQQEHHPREMNNRSRTLLCKYRCGQKFSKVSALVNLIYKATTELTFENFCLQPSPAILLPSSQLSPVPEILRSQRPSISTTKSHWILTFENICPLPAPPSRSRTRRWQSLPCLVATLRQWQLAETHW